MLNEVEIDGLKKALFYFFEKKNLEREIQILKIADFSIQYETSDFGVDYYTLQLAVTPVEFIEFAEISTQLEMNIHSAVQLFMKRYHDQISQVVIVVSLTGPLERIEISTAEKEELIRKLNSLKGTLISVATGGPRIQNANPVYMELRNETVERLAAIGIDAAEIYSDLWQWYGIWSSGDFPTYHQRRTHISDLISRIAEKLEAVGTNQLADVETTGWDRLDRTIREIKYRYSVAVEPEQFQAIGLLCRESLVTLAQMVYVPEIHERHCDHKPSPTDAKRMLDAFIVEELSGDSNENIRRFAKSSNDLANEITHKRTATRKETAVCINSTFSVVNIVYAFGERDQDNIF